MVSLRKLPLWIAFVVVANAVPASAGHMEALAQISRTQFSTPIYAYEFDEADDVAVSASAEYLTDPLISGTAAATVDFNHLGARSSASRTGGTAQLIAFSRTRLEDTIQAYDADGNVLTTGSAMGFFHVDGQLSGYSRMDFSWEFGDPDGGQDGSGISVGSESTNSPLTLVDDYQPFLI
ncbi:MAG: hypothetical protein JNG89_16070, partial [Planctomycetaceae bacterium]|nr:hypothetical protein [Planctomycetaceae bacterium]